MIYIFNDEQKQILESHSTTHIVSSTVKVDLGHCVFILKTNLQKSRPPP